MPGKEGLSTAEREELARLRRLVKQLQTERDILAKATAWFAGRSGGDHRDAYHEFMKEVNSKVEEGKTEREKLPYSNRSANTTFNLDYREASKKSEAF